MRHLKAQSLPIFFLIYIYPVCELITCINRISLSVILIEVFTNCLAVVAVTIVSWNWGCISLQLLGCSDWDVLIELHRLQRFVNAFLGTFYIKLLKQIPA